MAYQVNIRNQPAALMGGQIKGLRIFNDSIKAFTKRSMELSDRD